MRGHLVSRPQGGVSWPGTVVDGRNVLCDPAYLCGDPRESGDKRRSERAIERHALSRHSGPARDAVMAMEGREADRNGEEESQGDYQIAAQKRGSARLLRPGGLMKRPSGRRSRRYRHRHPYARDELAVWAILRSGAWGRSGRPAPSEA